MTQRGISRFPAIWTSGLGALMLCVGVLLAHGAYGQARGGTLTIVMTYPILGFEPTKLPQATWMVEEQLYDTLTRQDSHLTPQPRLAASWEFSADKLSLTLHLRKNVKFSDGSPFTAKSVVDIIKVYKDPAAASPIIGLINLIASADAPDDGTLVLHFARPVSNIFDTLDLLFLAKAQPIGDLDHKPIGLGPFWLQEYVQNDHATFVRNPYYWNADAVKLDRIVLRNAPDPQTAVLTFESGQADMIYGVPFTELKRLRAASDVTVEQVGEGSLVNAFALNVSRKPFDDERVRQAIALAMDRAAFVQSYFAGASNAWCLPWRPGTPAYDATPELARNCPFDLAKAKSLLATAGYPNGFSTSVLTSDGTWPGSSAAAKILQANLAKIGVTLNIDQAEPGLAVSRYVKSDFDMASQVYGRSNRSPATLFRGALPWRATNGATRYSSPQYSELVDAIETTTDEAKLSQLYKQINPLILNASWMVTIAPQYQVFAFKKKRVSGFTANIDGFPILEITSLLAQ